MFAHPFETARLRRRASQKQRASRERAALFAIVDENGFVDWLTGATPGDALVYYRGHLSHDRMPSAEALGDSDRRGLSDVANRVLAAEAQGLVMPVQRRVGQNDWLYVAIRRRGALRVPRHQHSPLSRARSPQHV
jgi:hypothetical protein